MTKNAKELISLTAFGRKHAVSRKTVSRWRDAGYVVPRGGGVDVERSEALLAQRPAEYKGGRTKGPTADAPLSDAPDFDLAAVIAGYDGMRAHCSGAADVYSEINKDLCALPADSTEADWGRVHYRHQDALRAALAPWLS